MFDVKSEFPPNSWNAGFEPAFEPQEPQWDAPFQFENAARGASDPSTWLDADIDGFSPALALDLDQKNFMLDSAADAGPAEYGLMGSGYAGRETTPAAEFAADLVSDLVPELVAAPPLPPPIPLTQVRSPESPTPAPAPAARSAHRGSRPVKARPQRPVQPARAKSWSAGGSVYKYVAHAQMAMQCDQRKRHVENQHAWLRISPMTSQRRAQIVARLREKTDVDSALALDVLALFEQQHVREKIEIMALEHRAQRRRRRQRPAHGCGGAGSNAGSDAELAALTSCDLHALNARLWLDQAAARLPDQQKQFPRLTVQDFGAALAVEVRTSSGYNDFTHSSAQGSVLSRWDCLLLELRDLSLLRESDDRRRKNKYYEFIEAKMKRPLNSFMLYRSALMKAVAILKVCEAVTQACRALGQRYPQLCERELLAAMRAVARDRAAGAVPGAALTPALTPETPAAVGSDALTPPSGVDADVVAHVLDAHFYDRDPVTGAARLVDPRFSNQTAVAQVITHMWNTELEEYKRSFVEFSQIEKQHHHHVYPEYKYCPVKKSQLS
ncbi:Transcription factor [Lachancea thermotolerans]